MDRHEASGARPRHSRTVEVRIQGVLDSWSGPQYNDELQQALHLRPGRLAIDLTECELVDHVGVLILLDIHRRACVIGTEVVVRNPSPAVERVLVTARIDQAIPIHRSSWALR